MTSNLHTSLIAGDGALMTVTNIPPMEAMRFAEHLAEQGAPQHVIAAARAAIDANFKAHQANLKKRINRLIDELLEQGVSDEAVLTWALALRSAPMGTKVTVCDPDGFEFDVAVWNPWDL